MSRERISEEAGTRLVLASVAEKDVRHQTGVLCLNLRRAGPRTTHRRRPIPSGPGEDETGLW